jgi:hypothetical protein
MYGKHVVTGKTAGYQLYNSSLISLKGGIYRIKKELLHHNSHLEP